MVLAALPFTLFVLFNQPAMQTLTARVAASYLSDHLKTEIRISGLSISLSKGLIVDGICLRDRSNAEIFSARRLAVSPGRVSIGKKILNIRKVYIDKGVIQLLTHKGDSALNLAFIIDYFSSADTTPKPEKAGGEPWKLSVSAVELNDTRFHLQDENAPPVDTGMDYSNIDVRHINLVIKDFIPDGDTMNAEIKSLSADERSGFAVHSLSGRFHVGPRFLKADNLKVVTNSCDLDLDFAFLYDSWDAYSDFLDKITIRAHIRPSVFNLTDIGTWAPVLYAMNNPFHISGDVRGTVSNFKARNFRVAFGENSSFFGNITANGLPDVEETFVDLNIKDLMATAQDIENLRLPEGSDSIRLPDFFKNAGLIKIKGLFTGFYNDFVSNAQMETDIGTVRTDLSLKKPTKGVPMRYSGTMDVLGFSLGSLFDSHDLMGRITCKADLKGQGTTIENADVAMYLQVDSLEINKYDYRSIRLEGTLRKKEFNGYFNVKDPNLDMVFRGLVDFHDSLPAFNFISSIRRAHLDRIHLLERDSVTDLTARIKAKFKGNALDNMEGYIMIDTLFYIEGEKSLSMDHFSLRTVKDATGVKRFKLLSDFADADFTGRFRFVDLIPSLTMFTENYIASFRLDSLIHHYPSTAQELRFDIHLKKTGELTDIFLPILEVAPGTDFSGSYLEDQGLFTLEGRSPHIGLMGTQMNRWFIDAKTKTDILTVRTGCDEFLAERPAKLDTTDIRADSVVLETVMRQDTVHFALDWKRYPHKSHFRGFASFRNDPKIELKMSEFSVFFDQRNWNIARDNFCIIDTADIRIHDLELTTGKESLLVDGIISANPEDTLYIRFESLDISNADHFIKGGNVDLDGILSGEVRLASVKEKMTIVSDLRIDDLDFNRENLGDADFSVHYNMGENRFDVSAKIIYTGNIGKNIPLAMDGTILLSGKNPSFDLTIDLKNLNLKMLGPFVSGFMSGIEGRLSGGLRITGTTENPLVLGKLNLMRTEFKINYLNVPYSLSDVITLDSNAIRFDNITLYDSLGNKAYLNGAIRHENFSNITLDLGIEVNDFSVFRNTLAQNSVFYGNARSSGTVRLKGPLDDIAIEAKAQTGGGTHVVIPINTTADISENSFIIFQQEESDTIEKEKKSQPIRAKGLSLDLNLKVNPDADVEVFFPGQMGNIKASGTGNLTMMLTPPSTFTLSGRYLISKGTFLFQLKNLLRLTFTIKDGSLIRWTGDPADADVAVSAGYKTRVPLQGVVTDPDLASVRIPVECIIRLSGKLMNPDLSFTINLPNVEEDIKTKVYSAIDTTNVSEMNQQMIYLLVMNQFKPVTGPGATVDLSSAPMSIVTNQLNSMISQMTHNVSVGINYQKGTSTTNEEFDVGVSTTLFNDRLLIDGTFGMSSNKGNTTQQQANNIVGDVNIEYVLTKDRRLRIRAFNRTNNVDALNNNAPYTQGIGISYQREFNRLSELFQSKKKKAK